MANPNPITCVNLTLSFEWSTNEQQHKLEGLNWDEAYVEVSEGLIITDGKIVFVPSGYETIVTQIVRLSGDEETY
jgi:hypothetical protein